MKYNNIPILLSLFLFSITILSFHIVALDVQIELSPSTTTNTQTSLPHNTRLYMNHIDNDFILLPTTQTITHFPQYTTSIPNIRFTAPNLQLQHISIQNQQTTLLRINTAPLPPSNTITLLDIYYFMKSPMVIGFIILFILAGLLRASFNNMSDEELKEFSRLTKGNGFNFQNLHKQD